MKEKTQTSIFLGIWLFFCCYFLQIFDVPNALVAVVGAGLCLLVAVQQKTIRIDLGIGLLAVTLISYYVIVNGVQGLTYIILYIPLIVCVLANYVTCSIKKGEEYNQKIIILLSALIIGFTIYGILNSYMYYAGYVVPGTRRWEDFWSREIVPGTQHTVYFLPMMAMFFPAIIFAKERKWKSILICMFTVFFCYTSLVTKSRMPLLIFLITVVLQVIAFSALEWKVVKKILFDKKTWIVMAALIVFMVAGFLFVKETAVVSAFINNLGKDGGILNNIRFVAQRQAICQLFDHPMGGRQMTMVLGNFCHNTWLDMANAGGLIPFFAFTAYTIYSLYELCALMKQKEISTEVKLMTVGIYGVFFLYFSVEPALDASIHYLTPWIFVNSMVHGLRENRGKSYE